MSYPEHEKLEKVQSDSQAVGEFLDTCGYTLCESRAEGNNGKPRYVWREGVEVCAAKGMPVEGRVPDRFDVMNCDADENPEYDSWPDGFYPVYQPISAILAKHYGIDQRALDLEKQAMLDELTRLRRPQ